MRAHSGEVVPGGWVAEQVVDVLLQAPIHGHQDQACGLSGNGGQQTAVMPWGPYLGGRVWHGWDGGKTNRGLRGYMNYS